MRFLITFFATNSIEAKKKGPQSTETTYVTVMFLIFQGGVICMEINLTFVLRFLLA